jgi:hypothetical protein
MENIYDRLLEAIETDKTQAKRSEPVRKEKREFLKTQVETMKEMSNMKDRKWKSTYRRCLRSLHSSKLHASLIPKSVDWRSLNKTAFNTFVDEAEKWLDEQYVLDIE